MIIFLKMVLYSLFIVFVWGFSCKLQKPGNEITHTELGERFIDWKTFSITYLVSALVFAIIFLFALSFPSNLSGRKQGIMYGSFLILISFFFFLSVLYGNVYVRIGKHDMQWRKMNGKKCKIHYEDISSYIMDCNGNLKLFQDDRCILSFATGKHKVFVTKVLKNHGIPTKKAETLVLKAGKGYVFFYFVCFVFCIFMFLMLAYYGILTGVLLFLICSFASFFLILFTLSHKIKIEEKTILVRGIFQKREVDFSDVRYLSLKTKNNTEVICIYCKNHIMIKVPKHYQGMEQLEELISIQHWKWQ